MAFIVDGEVITKDELKLLAHKRMVFEQLGFSEVEAFDMALAGVTVASVDALLGKGCPTELAAQILV